MIDERHQWVGSEECENGQYAGVTGSVGKQLSDPV